MLGATTAVSKNNANINTPYEGLAYFQCEDICVIYMIWI